jgi:cytochrome b6-f complex iron-sulfur subunit
MTKMDRRDFLKTSAAGGALLTIGGAAAPGCGNPVNAAPLARATVLTSLSQPSALPAATLNDVPGSVGYGTVQLQVPFYVDLAKMGGAITILLPVNAADQNRGYQIPPDGTILVVQRGANDFAAFQSSCPHAACPLGYSAKDDRIECPCHSSRFLVRNSPTDATQCAGTVTHLPAMASLQTWQVTFNDAEHLLTIDLNKPLDCAPPLPPLVGSTLTLPLASFPQLTMPGGSVAGQPMGSSVGLVIIRVDATTVMALNRTCTHLGCPVAYNGARKDLECPCHGSVFATNGAVLVGPATRPLTSYPTVLNADSVVITIV